MPTYRYADPVPRTYPAPPIGRQLDPDEELELAVDQVPLDGRFVDVATGEAVLPPPPEPAAAAPAPEKTPAKSTTKKAAS